MAQQPSQEQITQYFKAMADGKVQNQDLYGMAKRVGGRSNRVIHYRMTYPNGPTNPPVQNVTSEIAQNIDQAKAQVGGRRGIKKKTHTKKTKSSSGTRRNNIKKLSTKKKKKKKTSEAEVVVKKKKKKSSKK